MKKIFLSLFLFLFAANIFAQYKLDTVKYIEETSKYSITINYPKMYDAVNPDYERDFNLQMDEIFKLVKSNYEEIVSEITDADVIPYDLYQGFYVQYVDNDFISILFYDYQFTGGAHGLTYLTSYNYDFAKRKPRTLNDVFKGDYLKAISDYCIKDLKEMGLDDDEWIQEGASPKYENYSVYNFLKDGVLITFSHYQVGPYAIGNPQVFIPFSALESYMK